MRHPHTLRRLLLVAATILAAAPLTAPPASAVGPVVKPIVFPVDGAVTYTDTFGACRDGCSRHHEGQDLMGKRMLPLLAAVDGVVQRITFNNTSTGGNSVTIRGNDGWTYHYLHINNDTPGTDDGKATRAQAFPAHIVLGASVSRGQVIGYMGDSGNAESTSPHLHFEIRQPPAPGSYTGTPINAYESLRQATVWSTVSRWEIRRTATPGSAQDGFSYGIMKGDRGLLCDWDGDGLDEAVIVRGGTWYPRNGTATGGIAPSFVFGTGSHSVLCGDPDGDGVDEPIAFKNGTWTVRAGFASGDPYAWTVGYGVVAGDKPVIGDWDGDGDDDFGIKRGDTWHIRSTGTPAGAGVTSFRFGLKPQDIPVAGDWDGDGDDDAAIYRSGTWYLRSTAAASGGITSTFLFGVGNGQPLVTDGLNSATGPAGIATFRPRTA